MPAGDRLRERVPDQVPPSCGTGRVLGAQRVVVVRQFDVDVLRIGHDEGAPDRRVQPPGHLDTVGAVARVEGVAAIAVAVRHERDGIRAEAHEVEPRVRTQHRVVGPSHLGDAVAQRLGSLRELQRVPDPGGPELGHDPHLVRVEVHPARPTEESQREADRSAAVQRRVRRTGHEEARSTERHAAQEVAGRDDLRSPDLLHRRPQRVDLVRQRDLVDLDTCADRRGVRLDRCDLGVRMRVDACARHASRSA